jgi:hypothetical protein
VALYRVDNWAAPVWSVRDIDTFQDNFATDGTLTGTVRADIARDTLPPGNPAVLPGDCAVLRVASQAGLDDDPVDPTRRAVYCYVDVRSPSQAGKSGPAISGGERWPYVGSVLIGTTIWDRYRFDQEIVNGVPVPDTYCIDLNDNLFAPGDTIFFFYGARPTPPASATYFSLEYGTSLTASDAANNPMEFTCLPAGGYNRGGNILYVDGADGRGAQPYFDTAFARLGIEQYVDRFDIRGPSSACGNRLAGRAKFPTVVPSCYQTIIWDCGDDAITLGDGSGAPEKVDDYALLNIFLAAPSSVPRGVYLCGNNVGQQLWRSTSASTVVFKTTYLPFAPRAGSHTDLLGVSLPGVAVPGGCFTDDLIVYGGCPLRAFDVLQPIEPTVMQMSYGSPTHDNGAVISNVNGNARVMLSGFAFEYIRDDECNGDMDRARHLHDIITWLGNLVPQPTAAGGALRNALAQNYPNPFNPTTTIAFSIKSRGVVSVRVYNVAGELVRTLVNENRAAGPHAVVWDGRNDTGSPVASGVYFYRLVTKGFSQTRKMVLLK